MQRYKKIMGGGLEGGLDQICALREAENEQHYAFQPNQIGANTSFNHLFYSYHQHFLHHFVCHHHQDHHRQQHSFHIYQKETC